MGHNVFASYSHDDRAWRDAFLQMLIQPWRRWASRIDRRSPVITAADVVISPQLRRRRRLARSPAVHP